MSEIRPAGLEDLETVMIIVKKAVQRMNEQRINQWDDVYPDSSILKHDIQKQQMYVISEAGTINGIITLNEDQSEGYEKIPWKYAGEVLVVHRLTIHPRYQGKKLASCLMGFAEEFAVSKGYSTIHLDAFTNNPAAVGLYEKMGYRNAGIIEFRKGLFYCFEKSLLMP